MADTGHSVSTLRRQHGSRRLVEVEQLLQEQDGLWDRGQSEPLLARSHGDGQTAASWWAGVRLRVLAEQIKVLHNRRAAYVAGQLVDGSIFGHVVLFVWVVLWRRTEGGGVSAVLIIG